MSKLLVFVVLKNCYNVRAAPKLGSNQMQTDQAKYNYNSTHSFSYLLGTMHQRHTNFSRELEQTLKSESSYNNMKQLAKYATKYCKRQRKKRKHDKNCKVRPQYFNYLLLDPRITNDLTQRSFHMHTIDVWYTFLRSIFYVGKGKAARPYVHLRQASKALELAEHIRLAKDPKLALIVQIWQQKRGILLLRGFHRISSKDAHTREAAMIDALGMDHLTNRRQGSYFGFVRRDYTLPQRRALGIALLFKLFRLFMKMQECEFLPKHLIWLKKG